MPDEPKYPSLPIPSADPDRVVLYHGTPKLFEGPPTRGSKDVLRTGYPSMTADPYMADMFAGGGRDARIYATELPRDRILDLTGKRTRQLPKEIGKAAKSGRYDAVAIEDITTGGDSPEFRLINQPNESSWSVAPTAEQVENYGEFDDVVGRLGRGESITSDERERAIELLEEDIEYGDASEDMIETLKSLEEVGEANLDDITSAEERARQNQELLGRLRGPSAGDHLERASMDADASASRAVSLLEEHKAESNANDTTASVLRGIAEYDQEGFDENVMSRGRVHEQGGLLDALKNDFSDERMSALKEDLDQTWNPSSQTRERGRGDVRPARSYRYSRAPARIATRILSRGRGRLR